MSCETLAARIWPTPKDPSSKRKFRVDFSNDLALRWATTDENRTLGLFIRATVENGYDYQCTTAGRSGTKEPIWPKSLGATVIDGSATWTCVAPSTASLETTLSGTPTWTCADAAILISGLSVVGQNAYAFLDGGVDGQDYTIMVTATCADGSVVSVPCILNVRRGVFVCDDP